MVQRVTLEEINELKGKQIKVVRKDGSVVYKGPLAKPLIYNGVTYDDYLLLAEPYIIDGIAYRFLNQVLRHWSIGFEQHGYQIYCIYADNKTKFIRRGAALLHTFIGPPPEKSWTCNHMNVNNLEDRSLIRSDDLLDRLEWASLVGQRTDKYTPKNNAQSTAVIATHCISGEIKRFDSMVDTIDILNLERNQAVKSIRIGIPIDNWQLKYDTLEIMDGEIWKELTDRRYISSYGRLARRTKSGELVESHSRQKCEYIRLKIDNKSIGIHRAVVLIFGTDEDRHALELGHEVDHIDGDPRNNKISNLQVLNRTDHARKTHGNQIRVTDIQSNTTTIYNTQKEAYNDIQVAKTIISECLSNKREHKRYKFEYTE
jgi:hypothetical protein